MQGLIPGPGGQDLSQRQTLNQVSHPGPLRFINFINFFKEPAPSFVDLFCFSDFQFIDFCSNLYYFLPSAGFRFYLLFFFQLLLVSGQAIYFKFFLLLEVSLYCYKLSSQNCFPLSQRFWTIVFSFVSMCFLSSMISWLTHSLFSSILFNLHVFVVFPDFFLWLISSFIALWSEKMHGKKKCMV